MKTTNLLLLILIIIQVSCSTSSVKEKINQTGDAAGQALGEFASGVKNGVIKAIEPKIEISDKLKNKGIAFGKMTISNSSNGISNVLIAYIIFNSDFDGFIMAKAFDGKEQEMGRVKLEIKGKKDDAAYFEFTFDRRTEINNDSRIILE